MSRAPASYPPCIPTCRLAPPSLQVCYAEPFGDTSAAAACRSLGFPYGRLAQPPTTYGPGSGPVLLSSVQCGEAVRGLASCGYHVGMMYDSRLDSGCSHYEDVGVECLSERPPGAAAGRAGSSAALLGGLDIKSDRQAYSVALLARLRAQLRRRPARPPARPQTASQRCAS